jgi:hypothetical protein
VKGSQSLFENSEFNFPDLSVFERLYLEVTLQAMMCNVNNEQNYNWSLCDRKWDILGRYFSVFHSFTSSNLVTVMGPYISYLDLEVFLDRDHGLLIYDVSANFHDIEIRKPYITWTSNISDS